MRKIFISLAFLLIMQGCSVIGLKPGADEEKLREYSRTEILLADFSNKIIAYYEKQGLHIPGDFDERQFLEVLVKTYPDQSKVELIQANYKIKARPIGNDYSVMLCDTSNDEKLMEDLSCNLSYVEIRYWDKEDFCACKFEEDWKPLCDK